MWPPHPAQESLSHPAPLVTASPSWDPDMRWAPPWALKTCLMPMHCFFFQFFVGYTQPKNRWMSCTHQYPKGTFKRVKFLEKQIPQKATHHRNLQYGKYPKCLCLKQNCSKHLQSISSVSTLNFQRRTKDRHDFCQNPMIPKFQQKWRRFTRQLVTMCRIYSNQPPLTFARSFCLRSFVASTSQRWGSDPPWPQDGFGIRFETPQLW